MGYMKDFALELEKASNDEIVHIGAKEALEKIKKGVIDLGSETRHVKNHFNKIKGETKMKNDLTATRSTSNVATVTFDGGSFLVEVVNGAGGLPDKVIFQDEKQTVILKQGKKTTVVRAHDDEYSRVYGFLLAYFQTHSGLSKTKANRYLEDLLKVQSQVTTK